MAHYYQLSLVSKDKAKFALEEEEDQRLTRRT